MEVGRDVKEEIRQDSPYAILPPSDTLRVDD